MTKATMVLAIAGLGLLAMTGFQISAQHVQSARLAQLELQIATLQAAQGELVRAYVGGDRDSLRQLAMRAGYPASAATPRRADGVGHASPEQARREAALQLAQQEQAFDAEPVNAAWAGTTRQDVEDVLDALAQQGVAVPRSAAVDCRSRTCRIRLDLSGGEELDALLTPLLTELSDDLPEATILPMTSADGQRMDVQIFAGRGQGKAPHS